jgi:SAM-dependent methyltransferase
MESASSDREMELTREVIREFVQSSAQDIQAWFREFVETELDVRRSLEQQVAEKLGPLVDDVQREIGDKVQAIRAGALDGMVDVISEALHRDGPLVRKGIERVVSEAVAKEIMAQYSRDKVAWGDWTRAFSFEARAPKRATLGPVSEYLDTEIHVDYATPLLEKPIEECIALDGDPLPDTADREDYCGPRHYEYWLLGLGDYLKISQTAAKHGAELTKGAGVLDFGCATGRVLRHFVHQGDDLEVWGTDISRAHVEWINRHMPTGQRVFQGTVLPRLPIEDNKLRLAYALSVFTHIDEWEFAWLAELRRVLEPGGIAYLSIHTEDTWRDLNPNWAVYNDLLANADGIGDYDVSEEMFEGDMPDEKVVFRWRTATMNNTTVFTTKDYIRRTWGRFLEVVDIVNRGSDYQDVVVLRKS